MAEKELDDLIAWHEQNAERKVSQLNLNKVSYGR